MTGKMKGLIAAFTLAAVGFLGNAATGYNLFNKDDGSNFICDMSENCRYLTEDEIALAREYYGDEIDYKSVKVFKRPYFYTNKFHHLVQDFTPGASSVFGNIYAHSKDKQNTDDWTKRHSTSLIHELAHVWQYQQGGMSLYYSYLTDEGITTNASYDYKIDDHEHYLDFTMEQEAEIVEDIHELRMDIRTTWNWAAKAAKCAELQKLEEKARQELPIKPFNGCPKPPSP